MYAETLSRIVIVAGEKYGFCSFHLLLEMFFALSLFYYVELYTPCELPGTPDSFLETLDKLFYTLSGWRW
jgi:hypothetical protein